MFTVYTYYMYYHLFVIKIETCYVIFKIPSTAVSLSLSGGGAIQKQLAPPTGWLRSVCTAGATVSKPTCSHSASPWPRSSLGYQPTLTTCPGERYVGVQLVGLEEGGAK